MIRYLIPVAVFLSFAPAAAAQEPPTAMTCGSPRRCATAATTTWPSSSSSASPRAHRRTCSRNCRWSSPRPGSASPPRSRRRPSGSRSTARRATTSRSSSARTPATRALAEANIDIARVLNFQGKTELNQAILAEEAKTKQELAAQARTTLEQAAAKLAAAGKELRGRRRPAARPRRRSRTPSRRSEAEAAKLRAETEVQQTELDRALNLYDQAVVLQPRRQRRGGLQAPRSRPRSSSTPIASGSPRQPITWKARAWLGRIIFETETTDKAHAKFQEVILARDHARRRRRHPPRPYFRLKVIQEKPSHEEDDKAGVSNPIIDRRPGLAARLPAATGTPPRATA